MEAKRFSDLLNDSQFQFYPLKGLSFLWDSNFTSCRDIKDLDFLVKESDLASLVSDLAEQEYRSEVLARSFAGKLQLSIQHALELTAANSGLSVDLHWKLAESFIADAGLTKRYWQLGASSEMLLVNTTIQAYKNNWSVLQDYLDLKFILEEKDPDLVKFREIVEDYSFMKVAAYTFCQYDLIFGTSIFKDNFPNNSVTFNVSHGDSYYELRKYLFFNATIYRKIRAVFIRFILPYERDLASEDGSVIDVLRVTFKKLLRKFK